MRPRTTGNRQQSPRQQELGNDSGLMHVSAALGTPTIGMFGAGEPHIYGPWGEPCITICTPKSREELLALPPDGTNDPSLMKSLSVERVVEAANALLARTALAPRDESALATTANAVRGQVS